MDGRLHAIDLATGKARWQYATAGPIEESSPCVHGDVVYVGDLDGVVHAVDRVTGKARWTFKTEGEIKSSPNCLGDRIYIGSYDQHVYALSAATGALVWKALTEGPVHATPALDNGIVYAAGCDEQLHAIDAATGAPRFTVPLGAYAGASAAVRDGHAYVGTFGDQVVAIDLARHRVRLDVPARGQQLPVLRVGRRHGGSRDHRAAATSSCTRLDRSTGKAIWTFTTRARVESSPLVVGNRVFVGSNDGVLYELDLATGPEGLGVRRRSAALGVARGRPGRARHRIAGRRAVPLRFVRCDTMRIAYITAGAGHMYCGSCLRDNTLALALRAAGHDVLLIPTYTPTRTDEPNVSEDRVFLGGINVFLQQHLALFRQTPWALDRLLDFPPLLRLATRWGVSVDPPPAGRDDGVDAARPGRLPAQGDREARPVSRRRGRPGHRQRPELAAHRPGAGHQGRAWRAGVLHVPGRRDCFSTASENRTGRSRSS